MHPYEMASTMRARGKDDSVKLNFGSLYTVVESLGRHGLIEARETERLGKRPERTVYGLTEHGSRELVDWLAELLSVPAKEYLRFEAGLSYLPVLEPADAIRLLAVRCQRLRGELTQRRAVRQHIAELGVARLFVVEHEYMTALVEAELAWTEGLRADIESGALDGMELWNSIHRPHDTSLDATAPSA
ncbi:MAG: PadR family transcriptional regulator, partial [Acidimicrobiales bacterium]|jgi:DNA-binding PadR family transcriptional regulator